MTAAQLWNNDRAWAMRTSRDSKEARDRIRTELYDRGVLRQGWGYSDELNLNLIAAKVASKIELDGEEQAAWGNRKFLGRKAWPADNIMEIGDLVLLPNMPEDGLFTLCVLEGAYEYDTGGDDYRHMRKVRVLTPGGVANTADVVDQEIRKTLRCRSRLWWVGWGKPTLDAIISAVDRNDPGLREGTDHVQRALRKATPTLSAALDTAADNLRADLGKVLTSAEYEPLIQTALQPLMGQVVVQHIGGPSEQGADLEILIPNPFAPDRPWIIAAQVKDYQGEIRPHVLGQLRQAIEARAPARDGRPGGLLAVLLISTDAAPSQALQHGMAELSKEFGIQVACTHGRDVMRALTTGLLARGVALPVI